MWVFKCIVLFLQQDLCHNVSSVHVLNHLDKRTYRDEKNESAIGEVECMGQRDGLGIHII